MKNLFLILLVVVLQLTHIGCSKTTDEPTNKNYLIGKWKYIEARISNGGGLPTDWTPISNGYELSFGDNGTYSTTEYSTCNSGTFSINNQQINYFDSCGSSNPLEKSKIILNTETELVLQDLNSIEEALYKYQKISSIPN